MLETRIGVDDVPAFCHVFCFTFAIVLIANIKSRASCPDYSKRNRPDREHQEPGVLP